MKFVSPIQSRLETGAPSVKPASSPQESFSAIFASELRTLSKVPVTSSSPARDIKAVTAQKAEPAAAKSSFSQIFPHLSAPVIKSTADQNGSPSSEVSGKIVPGIVNIPMPAASAVIRPDKTAAIKKSGAIDIASIVNFARPGSRMAAAAPTNGAIVSTGGNPSVVVSSRSKAPSTEWDRYRMESSPQNQKGGVLGGGVMVALRIEIG